MAEISRRSFLRTAAAIGVGATSGLVAHGYAFERHALQLVHIDLRLSGLPRAFDGLRIGFITDLHHSAFVSLEDIDRAVSRLLVEAPDLVLLGGDYVSYGDRRFAEPCAETLGRLTAPLGVFAVLGNHDDERYVPAALAKHRIAVLRDQWTAVSRSGASFVLAGVRFWTRGISDIGNALNGAAQPIVLAAHDPRRFYEAAALDVGGVLAGHTHGGQVVIPGIGALAARKFPIAAGLARRGHTELFVSRGVGTVILPLRINCPPEIAVVTLRSQGELG